MTAKQVVESTWVQWIFGVLFIMIGFYISQNYITRSEAAKIAGEVVLQMATRRLTAD